MKYFSFIYKLPRNIIVAALALYTLLGFFLVPFIIEGQLEKFVIENYKEKLEVEKIYFNPFTFVLSIDNLNIPDTNPESADKSRLKFQHLLLNLEIFPLLTKKITFKEATLNGAHIYFSFYKNKRHNWTSHIPPSPNKKEEATSSNWTLVLEKLTLDKDYFQFRDFNYPTPVNLPFGPLGLKASNVSTKIGEQSALESLFINLGKQGSLKLSGKLGLTPPRADINLVAKGFPLDFLTSYLSQTTYLELQKGFLNFNGNLNYKQGAFKIAGDAGIDDLLLKMSTDQSEVLSIAKADFRSLNYSTLPASFTLEEMALHNLKTYILLKPDGTLNYKSLLKNSQAPTGPSDEKKNTNMTYSIKTIVFNNSALDFNDWQIKPKFSAHIHTLNGTIGPVSSNLENKIGINLNGMVDDLGKFTSQGHYFQAQRPTNLDLGVKFSNIEMTTFTPYSGFFMGYEIKKGKLFLDVNYTLKKNRIVGKNNVRLDQFTLGEKIDSKNATNLPLRLAVALLKDRKGQIKFKLPIEGDTNAPKFSYGSAIRTALFNMIVNIAMAPFDFLADVFGVGKEIKMIEFENQTIQFKAENEAKLDTVVKMMEERPELRLEILGTCSEKEFMTPNQKEPPVIEEARYKEIGLQRAQLVQNILAKKNINAERLFVMAGKKNDDSIGPSGVVLIFKVD